MSHDCIQVRYSVSTCGFLQVCAIYQAHLLITGFIYMAVSMWTVNYCCNKKAVLTVLSILFKYMGKKKTPNSKNPNKRFDYSSQFLLVCVFFINSLLDETVQKSSVVFCKGKIKCFSDGSMKNFGRFRHKVFHELQACFCT